MSLYSKWMQQQLSHIQVEEDFLKSIEGIRHYINTASFSYQWVNRSEGDLHLVPSRPDWPKIYSKERYINIDPRLDPPQHNIDIVIWSEQMWKGRDVRAMRECEIRNGFGYQGVSVRIIDHSGDMAVVNLSSEVHRREWTKTVDSISNELASISELLHSAAKRIYTSHNPEKPPAFTRRELQVATLMANGASQDEAAQLLNISINAVKHHLKNIRIKMKARNTTHAVALACFKRNIVAKR